MPDKNKRSVKKTAFAFIILMGIVSMFSDMTHEGAAGIMGAYLGLAGASAAAIGFVSGLGEFIGYSLRLFTGWLTDKTKKYWTMAVIGYVIDCCAIPALALVPKGGWILACMLIVIQRTGKAIKKPAKDTLLSFAAGCNGVGKSFAVQELLDQVGAFLGPVLLFVIMLMKKNEDLFSTYSFCFAILGIPAVITVALLLFAKKKYPDPEKFEEPSANAPDHFTIKKSFVFYLVAISFFAAGFIDFPLITLRASQTHAVPSDMLSLLYAGAMAVDALSALFFGWLYDKKGVRVLMLSTLISSPFALLVFCSGSTAGFIAGAALWGIGMGAQESIMKAAVTQIVPKENRSVGFGIFQTSFGVFWFAGSWLTGVLYDHSMLAMALFSLAMQLISLPFFEMSFRYHQKEIGS